MEQAALIAMLRRRRSGWASVTDAVEEAGSALLVLKNESDQTRPQHGEFFTVDTDNTRDLELAMADLRAWASEGLTFTSVLDADYPQQLLTIHQRPPFLLYRGRLDARDARGVAVVGTRHPSPRGVEQATAIARGLCGARHGCDQRSG